MEKFVELMETRMEQLGVSATRLAKLTGKSRTSIFNILNGKQRPALPLAAKVAKFLGFSLDDAFGLSSMTLEETLAALPTETVNDSNDSEENSEAV